MVTVICPACGGTGDGEDGVHMCTYCLAQGHIRVDRDRDGTVPSGMREWVDAMRGPVPDNPLTLRSEADARP